MRCKNGIDYDECKNDVDPNYGEYCPTCAEKNYDDYIEMMLEGIGAPTLQQQQRNAQRVK